MNKRKKINYPIIDNVEIIEACGPWKTKSGGHLNVLFAIPWGILKKDFFSCANDGLALGGLRVYTVDDLEYGKIGGGEWHKIRKEIVFAIEGSVQWICEDISGNQKNVMINSRVGVFVPPYILHAYKVLKEGSRLLVIANTIFDPSDPTTHDSYSIGEFVVEDLERRSS